MFKPGENNAHCEAPEGLLITGGTSGTGKIVWGGGGFTLGGGITPQGIEIPTSYLLSFNGSTNGTVYIKDDSYIRFGALRSNGGPYLAYGLYADSVTANSYLSSTAVGIGRGAIDFINPGTFRITVGTAETTAAGSPPVNTSLAATFSSTTVLLNKDVTMGTSGSASTASHTMYGYLLVANSRIGYSNTSVPSVYATATGGSGFFNEAGHLILEPRLSGATRDVIIMGAGGAASHRFSGLGASTLGMPYVSGAGTDTTHTIRSPGTCFLDVSTLNTNSAKYCRINMQQAYTAGTAAANQLFSDVERDNVADAAALEIVAGRGAALSARTCISLKNYTVELMNLTPTNINLFKDTRTTTLRVSDNAAAGQYTANTLMIQKASIVGIGPDTSTHGQVIIYGASSNGSSAAQYFRTFPGGTNNSSGAGSDDTANTIGVGVAFGKVGAYNPTFQVSANVAGFTTLQVANDSTADANRIMTASALSLASGSPTYWDIAASATKAALYWTGGNLVLAVGASYPNGTRKYTITALNPDGVSF